MTSLVDATGERKLMNKPTTHHSSHTTHPSPLTIAQSASCSRACRLPSPTLLLRPALPTRCSWHVSLCAAGNEKALVLLTGIIGAVAVILLLYWAQKVLIPVALALFFAFLLNPIVMQFQRWRLPRVLSVVAVTLLAATSFFAFGWLVVSQIGGLAGELPNYTDNIKKKMESVATLSENSFWPPIEEMLHDLGILSEPPKSPDPERKLIQPPPGATPQPPLPVVIAESEPPWVRWLPNVFGPATELLGQIGLVVVLVVFVLLAREDLRNRFIRLVGHGRLTVTTKAVDDASQRLSRFLLAQLTLNVGFGLCVTIGLMLIGVPFALMWGFLGGVMRYVPYIGSAIAALFPVLLSIAQFDGWLEPILVAALIVSLEVIAANVFEPWLFGHSIGVSAVALLISAAFWAFLWGPIGLVLSCPLTVCLVVLGKYVPNLEFLAVLLGDQPALNQDFIYYQRLSAHDQDEATDIALDFAKEHPIDEVYDALLIPALTYAGRDFQRQGLDDDDVAFIVEATREILADLDDLRLERRSKEAKSLATDQLAPGSEKVLLVGIPGRSQSDLLALEMLRQLLEDEQCELKVSGSEVLSSELLQMIEEQAAHGCLHWRRSSRWSGARPLFMQALACTFSQAAHRRGPLGSDWPGRPARASAPRRRG